MILPNKITLIKYAVSLVTVFIIFATGAYFIYTHGYNVGYNEVLAEKNKEIYDIIEQKNKELEATLLEIDRQNKLNNDLLKEKQTLQSKLEKERQNIKPKIERMKNDNEKNKTWLHDVVPNDVVDFLRNNE